MPKTKFIGYFLLSFVTLFTICLSGILNQQREIDIVVSVKGQPKSSFNISLLGKDNQIIKSYPLTEKNSIQKIHKRKYKTTFWIDPTYVQSLQIGSDSSALLDKIDKIELKNILGTHPLNFTISSDKGQVEATLPPLKDPLIYADYFFVISVLSFLAIISILYKSEIYFHLKPFLETHSPKLKVALVGTMAVAALIYINYPKTLSPFYIRLKGNNLSPAPYKVYLDSGQGFNEVEKTYSFTPSKQSSASTQTIEIANNSEISKLPTDNNGEIFLTRITINGASIPLETLTNLNETEIVYNKLFIPINNTIKFNQYFQTLFLDTIKHPHSGNISIFRNGQIIVNENLYHPEDSHGNRIVVDGLEEQNRFEDGRLAESTILPHFNRGNIKDLRIDSDSKDFLESIDEILLLSSLGSSTTTIKRENGTIFFIPDDPNFNRFTSNFQIFSTVLFLILWFFLSFQILLLANSKWFSENISLKILIPSFCLIFLFFHSLLLSTWPGIFTLDSFLIFDTQDSLISNYKPLLYSIYLGVLSNFSRSLATPQVFQIFIFSLTVSTLISLCTKKGVSYIWYLLTLLFFLATPTLTLYLITLWKDIPSSLGMMLLAIVLSLMAVYKLNFSKNLYILFSIVLPLTIATSGVKHNGFLIPFTVAFILIFFKLMPKKTAFIYLCSAIVLSSFSISLSSVILDSKAKTDLKRLELFPYIVYASYVSWGDYLAGLSKEDAQVSEQNISKIAKVEDQIGVDLMFNPEKANLSASKSQIKLFKKEVIKAIFANPYYFFRSLLISNCLLLDGKGYIWDKGFLPINDNIKYELSEYSNEIHFPSKDFSGNKFGKRILNFYSDVLNLKNNSYLASLCFSYFPPIFIFLFSIFIWREHKGVQIFSLLILLQYLGIFIMPASMEFRYAFFFVPACVVLPLLKGLETKIESQNP